MDNYSEGLATGMALQQGNGYVNGYNNGGFGGNGSWGELIGLIVVAGLFGFGNFGGGNRGGSSCATQADLAAGFNNSAVLSSLNDIKLGQAQAINFNNQGFYGLNTTLLQGFAGVDNAVCTLGYNLQSGFNGLSRELGDCCCKTQIAIQDLKYANERQTCDLINVSNANTRAILDYLTNEKIEGLRAENVALKGQISNDRQSAYIINALSPKCPEPAYIVPNPNCCYQYNVQGVGYNGVGYGNGCSCSAL